MSKLGQFQRIELGFDLDDFHKPILYTGPEAWVHQILQLAMIEPGTIPSNPTIGIGAKHYDFLLEDDRRKLASEINRQVPIFFPDMPFKSCTVQSPDNDEDKDIIYLFITFTVNTSLETVVVAVKKGYKYIDFAIAM